VHTRREEWSQLDPDDVAWVTEWQLVSAFPWLPLGAECPVSAAPWPEAGGRFWRAAVRAGGRSVEVRLPLRDLGKLVQWCPSVRLPRELARVPAPVRGAMLALRRALSRQLSRLDPLEGMGHAEPEPKPREQ
jgi:hypothetical protein